MTPLQRALILAPGPVRSVLARRHVHTDVAARVGYFFAWECTSCGRVEVTDRDLRAPAVRGG